MGPEKVTGHTAVEYRAAEWKLNIAELNEENDIRCFSFQVSMECINFLVAVTKCLARRNLKENFILT